MWLRSAVDAIDEQGGRGLPPRELLPLYNSWHLPVLLQSSFPCQISRRDGSGRGHSRFWAKILVMSTTLPQESLLSASAAWLRCRAYTAGSVGCLLEYAPCLKMTLLPRLQSDCTDRFGGRLAFDAQLRGNLRLYGGFLGDLYA